MSSAGWVFVWLLFICPFYEASEIKEKSALIKDRQRRSIINLQDMVKAVTGRAGTDFLNYGNWCGLGGSGNPVDPIDECCQNHDICYDLAKKGECREAGEKGVYKLEYKWRVVDETAVCEKENDQCKLIICMCDAIISNCLKSNLEFYNADNLQAYDLYQLIKDADFIASN